MRRSVLGGLTVSLCALAPLAHADEVKVASLGPDDVKVASLGPDDGAALDRAPAATPVGADEMSNPYDETKPRPEPTPPVAPYSLPWQLRSASPATYARVDHVAAPYSSTTASGIAQVTTLSGAYKVLPTFAVFARGAFINDGIQSERSGNAVSNPVVGGTWGDKLHAWRYAAMFSFAPPVGSGGGNHPDAAASRAMKTGHLARFALDGSLFAVNDFTTVVGGDAAYVTRGLTLQFEATAAQLFRTRGEAVSPDASRSNFLTGAHVGYWVIKQLCAAGELRYQRWLSTPAAVQKDPSARDNLSVAAGMRTSFATGDFKVFPSLALAMGLKGPVASQHVRAVELDVPFVF